MIAPDLETAIDALAGARRRGPRDRAVHRRRHFDRVRHSGLPLPGRVVDQEPADPVRRVLASQEMRDEAWRRRFAMEEQFAAARPGRGHLALASLYRAGKAPARDHAEHRQSASGLGHCSRTRDRAARQYHLRHLPRLRQALRARVGARALRRSAAAARPIAPAAAATSRPRRSPSVRRCRSARCGAPSRLTLDCDLFLAIGSSLVVWPAAGFPLDGETQWRAPRDHQSRSRPNSTKLPILSCATTSERCYLLSSPIDFGNAGKDVHSHPTSFSCADCILVFSVRRAGCYLRVAADS